METKLIQLGIQKQKSMIFKHHIILLFFVFFTTQICLGDTISNNKIYNEIKTEKLSEKYFFEKYKYEDYNKHLERQRNKKEAQNKKNDSINQTDSETVKNIFSVIGGVLFIIIVGGLLFFIIKNRGLNLFNKSSKKIYSDTYLAQNIHEIDLEELLNDALKNNQKELVIRFYFLIFLKKIAQENYIKWHPEKTNTEYLYEISNIKLKKDFEYASYLYTYIWYGKFEITDELYNTAQNHFKSIIKKY